MTGFESRLIYAVSTASNTAENRAVLHTHVRKPGHREDEVIGGYRRTTESVVVRFSSGESDEPLLNLIPVLPVRAREMATMPARKRAERQTIDGKRIRQDADGHWSVEGWPEEIYEDEAVVEHLLLLELVEDACRDQPADRAGGRQTDPDSQGGRSSNTHRGAARDRRALTM
jgi:hypothetical protein